MTITNIRLISIDGHQMEIEMHDELGERNLRVQYRHEGEGYERKHHQLGITSFYIHLFLNYVVIGRKLTGRKGNDEHRENKNERHTSADLNFQKTESIHISSQIPKLDLHLNRDLLIHTYDRMLGKLCLH